MRFPLGIPDRLAGAPLPRRLAWLTLARLVFLSALLALVVLLYLRGRLDLGSFSMRTAFLVLGASIALSGVYAALLRVGRWLEPLADLQLVLDQLAWSVIVYLSGGASSGATSLYGLSCLVGAILTGIRGALVAAISGALCFAATVLSLERGWLHAPPDQPPSLYAPSSYELAYYLAVNLLMLVVVTLLAGYLAERLRLTGGQLVLAEERAHEAEHLAALGRLTAGLAHEIRNPLSSIAGSIRLLESSPALSEEDRELCGIVEREAARLNDLVTDMMDLSRPRAPVFARVDAAGVACEVVALASRSGRAASDVRVVYSGESKLVIRADSAQLRQLVWNLVRNAVQASGAGDTVTVAVERVGERATLSVADTGIGIDDEAKSRIFDAFFTTRSQGTGVGLAVVKRIADAHGFALAVDSSAGRGAVFRVELSAALATAPELPGGDA